MVQTGIQTQEFQVFYHILQAVRQILATLRNGIPLSLEVYIGVSQSVVVKCQNEGGWIPLVRIQVGSETDVFKASALRDDLNFDSGKCLGSLEVCHSAETEIVSHVAIWELSEQLLHLSRYLVGIFAPFFGAPRALLENHLSFYNMFSGLSSAHEPVCKLHSLPAFQVDQVHMYFCSFNPPQLSRPQLLEAPFHFFINLLSFHFFPFSGRRR